MTLEASLKPLKLRLDLIFNFASVGIMGVSAILINIFIAAFYDAATLGIFNQIFAIYIFASQLAVVGMPFSVLKYSAEYSADFALCRTIIASALLLSLGTSTLISGATLAAHEQIGNILNSPGVANGLLWAAPGLCFFSINKILLSALNGLQRMRLYAILQSARYIFILISLGTLTIIQWPGENLAFAFTLGEGGLIILCLGALRKYLIPRWEDLAEWARKHIDFGLRSFINTLLLELNTRVDVLMLGVFCNDHMVGVYSFAAMLAEGVLQILTAAQRVVTPHLVKYWAIRDFAGLKTFSAKIIRNTYLGMTVLMVVTCVTYPLWITLLTGKSELQDTRHIFTIIVSGVVFSSGYIPLRNILMGAGYPGWQSIQTLIIVLINVVGNACLIPSFGITGAAVGTAISLASTALIVKSMTRWRLGVSF